MLISKTYQKFTPDPEADPDGDFYDVYDQEDGFIFHSEPHTFREVVELMRTHNEPSASPVLPNNCARDVWLSDNEAYEGTIESIENGVRGQTCIHFCPTNPERLQKYWRKAMHLAGVRIN